MWGWGGFAWSPYMHAYMHVDVYLYTRICIDIRTRIVRTVSFQNFMFVFAA